MSFTKKTNSFLLYLILVFILAGCAG
ncbi:uncharacterized protein METZ01_LOCUS60351, partial [marine metagenome]